MSFDPIFSAQSHTLILGTYPSPASREAGFYYGHPRNRFWPVLAGLFSEAPPQTAAGKTALLLRRNLALWDVCASCDITGAADSTIERVIPNDPRVLFDHCAIRAVFCNGAKAGELYRKCWGGLSLPMTVLPSTSPANAGWSTERLAQAWAVIIDRDRPAL